MRFLLSITTLLAFLIENIATILIGTLLLLALFFAGRSVYKKRKQGGCAGCSGCEGNSTCVSSINSSSCCGCAEHGGSE